MYALLQAAFPDSAAVASSVDNALPYLTMQLSNDEKMALGYQLNDTIKNCFYDGKPCDMKRYNTLNSKKCIS